MADGVLGRDPALGAHLAAESAALTLETLPPAVRAGIKLSFLDFLSCVYGAVDMPWNAAVVAYAGRGCGQGGATILGTPFHGPPAESAFVNSTLAAGASRSDMHPPSASHPALVIFPTLLALAAEAPLEGTGFLLAAVAGYEAMGRLGRALVTSENSRHFRPSGLCGPVGAALAGARALGLGRDATLSAMGIAGNAAGGLMEWAHSGAPDLRYQPAQAARAATAAVLFAREGGEGSHSIIEGPAGLLATFAAPPERRALLAEPWGPRFEIEDIEYKAVPICVFAQAAAFAAKALIAQRPLEPARIRSLEIHTFSKAIDYPGCAFAGPIRTPQEARMSIPFSVASVLVLRALDDANFNALGNREIDRLAAATTLIRDPAMDAAFPAHQRARVIALLSDGDRLECGIESLPRFGQDQVRERFRSCAAAIIGPARTLQVERLVESIEQIGDLSALTSLLGRDQARPAA